MSTIFDTPKAPAALPVVNPADTQNRMNAALQTRLQTQGTNSTLLGDMMATNTSAKAPSLTGIN